MIKVFSDTLFWNAIVNRHDQWHAKANEALTRIANACLVTTDEVLTEVLASLSYRGVHLRREALSITRSVLDDPNVMVHRQSRLTFLRGLDLYERRRDKAYSLVDCISMNTCWHEGISGVLTNDHHFSQEGFDILIPWIARFSRGANNEEQATIPSQCIQPGAGCSIAHRR